MSESAPARASSGPRSLLGRGLLRVLRFYREAVSPALPPRCRYYPTCSEYAVSAIRMRGALIGLGLGLWRLLRCNPWSSGGVDFPPGVSVPSPRRADQPHSRPPALVPTTETERLGA